ncbi:hypothetical protein SPRG_01065 [Saprolegnia parasitica CBS 223.65]|uniref:protein-histidine N-methyltransferase n=1 Tax=Saprolegnia parasitica (strain CBS 223.65) TaxID=695850 RepID=A0A067D7L4_SAPPC|nr:hypothetical protein SPRG_01065 [Saprolegnia parasitica CBS 223.65]KDO35002.1 hypothetical protein SPRG_01065 [Saprolegnia parasitica CBS 223.65]|eukprot:XP_012194655.1 hypothetical protein SPRG_01065 [Saprolegnia parasitica CBS 223.65]
METLLPLLRATPSSASLLSNASAVAQLANAVQAIRRTDRAAAPIARPSTEADLADFEAWFAGAVGASDAKYTFRHMGPAQGNGVVASCAIAAGERVLFVPEHLLLTSSTAQLPSFAPLQADPLLSQFPSAMLALRLLYEMQQGAKSPLAAYLRILPSRFYLPFDYSGDDFAALMSTMAYAPAVQLLYNGLKQYTYLHARLSSLSLVPISTFTLENFLWATSVVLTRQNNVPTPADPRALALIPGWDLCNHAPGAITTYFEAAQRGVVCDAMTSFAPGEQLTIFYGPRPNAELLVYSGFCLPVNAYDTLRLRLVAGPDDALWKVRAMVLTKLGATLDGDAALVRVTSDGAFAAAIDQRTTHVLLLDKAGLGAALRSLPAFLPWTDEVAARAKSLLAQAAAAQLASLQQQPGAHAAVVAAYVASEAALLQRLLGSQQ